MALLHQIISLVIVVTSLLSFCYGEKDYYRILGIERDASQPEIKRAFRQLSLKLHPDKNPGDEDAVKKFTDVANAYGILSDSDKKRRYDQYGEEGLKNGAQYEEDGHDPFDVFSNFFGGGGNRRRQQQEEARGPDVIIPLRVSMNDLYNGKQVYFSYRRQVLCPHCRGKGGEHEHDVRPCPHCGGHGIRIETRRLGPGFVQQFQTTCDQCQGKGKIVDSTCSVCSGTKTVFGDVEFDIEIAPGMPDGHQIEHEHYGDEFANQRAGHLILQVVMLPHDLFTRDGNDLWMEFSISLREALVGFSKSFTHLDGRSVEISREKITKPRQVITLPNEGMPVHHSTGKGSLKIKFDVIFPAKLNAQQRKGFKELFSHFKF